MNDHVQLREFIERIIQENDRRIDDRFKALDKALILQAAAYPTTKDFNELKTHVDSEYGIRTAIAMIAAGLAVLISIVMALLTYFHKGV